MNLTSLRVWWQTEKQQVPMTQTLDVQCICIQRELTNRCLEACIVNFRLFKLQVQSAHGGSNSLDENLLNILPRWRIILFYHFAPSILSSTTFLHWCSPFTRTESHSSSPNANEVLCLHIKASTTISILFLFDAFALTTGLTFHH